MKLSLDLLHYDPLSEAMMMLYEMMQKKIEEYYNLKQVQKLTEERLLKLNKEIKDELLSNIEGELPETVALETSRHLAQIDVKRTKTRPDETLLEQLLMRKNLWGQAVKIVVDHAAVEQLYLTGRITDHDLRSIGAENKVTLALRVEKVDSNV